MYGAETCILRKIDLIYLESVKCGAGEGWKRSLGTIVSEMKKYYIESRKKGISYMQ